LTAASVLGRLQLVQPLAIGGNTPRYEQFGDQFVLGAEVIVDRGEIDAGRGDDVAQRHVGEATFGIELFGGVEDRRSGSICRHQCRASLCQMRHAGRTCPDTIWRLQFKQLYETIVS